MNQFKSKFQNMEGTEVLSREQLKQIVGAMDDCGCPTGQFKCTCNGVSYGCVSSVQECWNKC